MLSNIVIVGGGTAGWMTALYLAEKLAQKVQIDLVEWDCPDLACDGNSSTPSLRSFFSSLGIAETDWMAACDATYKTGILFKHWANLKQQGSYFHPYFSAFDKKPAEMFFYNSDLKRQGFQSDTQPEHYFVSAYLALQKRSPVGKSELPTEIEYGYHLNPEKLVEYVRGRACAAGVNRHTAAVRSVATSRDLDIKKVITASGQTLIADLFIDCSGFQSILLQKTQKRFFNSYQDALFNDSLVLTHIPTETTQGYHPQTTLTTMDAGWLWQAPLTGYQACGYAYSSEHIKQENALVELIEVLKLQDSDMTAQHLKVKTGRVDQPWFRNCVAIGHAQGYIEPMSGAGFEMVQTSVERIADVLNQVSVDVNAIEKYNKAINKHFDGMRDYCSMHYALNTRYDCDYWIDVREKAKPSETVKHLLKSWDRGDDFEQAIRQVKEEVSLPKADWYSMFSGMGRHANHLRPCNKAGPSNVAIAYCKKIAEKHFPML